MWTRRKTCWLLALPVLGAALLAVPACTDSSWSPVDTGDSREHSVDAPVDLPTSPVADAATIRRIMHLPEIEGLPPDYFAHHYWFDPAFGDDTATGTHEDPFRTYAHAKVVCQLEPYTRCTVITHDGHAWFSPHQLTVATLDEFQVDEPVFWGAADAPGSVQAWLPDPEGRAPGCAAPPCGVVVISMDHPPGWPALCVGGSEPGTACDFYCAGGSEDGKTCSGEGSAPACAAGGGTCRGDDADCAGGGTCTNHPDRAPTSRDTLRTADDRLGGVVIDAVTDTLHHQLADTHAWGGTVSASDTTHIHDDSAPFVPGALVGQYVFNDDDDFRLITANTATSLTVFPTLEGPWGRGTVYKVGYGAAQLTWNPGCTGDPDAACILFEADDRDARVHVDCSNDDPEDPNGAALHMVDDRKDSGDGWLVVQHFEASRCINDVFSTAQTNGGNDPTVGDGGKMLVVDSGGSHIVNIENTDFNGATNNNVFTTHGNGWIVGLNAWGDVHQDSSGSAGAPVAATGSGGIVLIGHEPIVASGAAYGERAQSVFSPVPIVTTGGDVFLVGHEIRCGGAASGLCIDYQMSTSEESNPRAGDENGSSITLVQVRHAGWIGSVRNRWRSFTTVSGFPNRYMRFEAYGTALGDVVPLQGVRRCLQVGKGDIFDTSPASWIKLRGVAMSGCDSYLSDLEGRSQTANYRVDIQQSTYDPDDADNGRFCEIGADAYSLEDCRLAANNGNGSWSLWTDAGSVAPGTSIGEVRIRLPGDEGGYVPWWVLGTSQNITELEPELHVGVPW
jgi:hypothetical protein